MLNEALLFSVSSAAFFDGVISVALASIMPEGSRE